MTVSIRSVAMGQCRPLAAVQPSASCWVSFYSLCSDGSVSTGSASSDGGHGRSFYSLCSDGSVSTACSNLSRPSWPFLFAL